uniref:NADH dehydrogenase subunit 4L n=1 Tax=Megalophaedusa kyotoensis TaxID=1885762 RepID=A0A224AAN8_9EUPU|nr:NADH dehydrogenase subunit 4L [Megalophaedusa kyotoensis]
MLASWFLLLLMFFLFFCFFSVKNQYLSALLMLETLVLTSLIFIMFLMSSYSSDLWIFLLMLTFGVSEAGLGLALLLTNLKMSGSDYINFQANNIY